MLYDNEKREIKFNHNTFIKAIFLGGGGEGACNDLVVRGSEKDLLFMV